ncbi:MAG TPA: hypothetical protein V6D15_05860 [Oculatellaceae cyanobacterium]
MSQNGMNVSQLGQTQRLNKLGFVLTTTWLTLGAIPALSQSTPSACQAPRSGEYLVLVVSQTKQRQEQVRLALPRNRQTKVCRYVDNVVTRVGSLKSVTEANNLVRYMQDIVGLPAFVARMQTPPPKTATRLSPPPKTAATLSPVFVATPAQASFTTLPLIPVNPPAPPQRTVAQNTGNFPPELLGYGFAVLVDYSNQPQLVNQVRELMGGNVGLASYGQRSYLLAVHTTNQREASSTWQRLSDRGLLAMLVDSRKVTLLRPQFTNP